MSQMLNRSLLLAGGGLLLLSGIGQSVFAELSMRDLEEKARGSEQSLQQVLAEYGHLLPQEKELPAEDLELYKYYKNLDEPAPRWLTSRLFPDAGGTRDGSRDGGDTPEVALEIPFVAGSTWTDSGTTVGFTDVVPTNQAAPASCATSFYASSSFGGPDAWYTFTLEDSYEVGASVCDAATYDSCIGIFDANLNLVAVNDDGAGCLDFSSELPPCCLPAGTYYLVMDSYGVNEGTYDLSVTFSDAACQDPCEAYTEDITAVSDPESLTGTTVDAADLTDDGFGEVGFDIDFTLGGLLSVDACDANTDVDVRLYLYDNSPCDGGVLLAQSTATACNEGGATNPGLISNFSFAPGSYHLMVSSPTAGEGAFTVNFHSPCDAYETVQTLSPPALVSGSTLDGVDIYGGTGLDEGYDIEISEAGFYDIDACFPGTDYSVALYLFDGHPCEGGQLHTMQGWTTCGVSAGAARILELYLEAGSYHLLVGDDFDLSGNYEIQIQATPDRPTAGGPDEAGYGWISSLDPEGPEYDWIDISQDPEAITVTLADDAGAGPFPMGLDFAFYGGVYSDVYISSNGHLNFLASSSSLSNQQFPSTNVPNATIAMFWDDLDPGDGVGTVQYLADAANELFIVQFTGVPDFPGPNGPPNTFQAILGADGSIMIQLNDLQGDRTSCTIGIENEDGTIGLNYNYNTEGGLVANEVAIEFGQLEGDFLAPVISFDSIPETMETELPGDHLVTATITDDSGVASATLFYQINNGAVNEVTMSNSEGDTWVGGIPHQDMGSNVSWWVEAVDDTDRENTRVSPTYGFEVVSYTWPPLALTATDGLLDYCQIDWLAPVAPEVALRWFGGNMPASENEALQRLMSEHGLAKIDAHQTWQDILNSPRNASRAFLNYNIYRDDELVGTTTDLVFYDLPGNGAEPNTDYTYHVTAQFDAGESELSNTDVGSRGARPTSGGPDEMGYTWINSHDPEGPVFEWFEINEIGTDLAITGDDTSGPITIPWPFPFYDFDYTTALVSSNGYLTFGTDGTDYTNDPIMDPLEPNDAIFPFWDDLTSSSLGSIYFYDDSAENGRVIIEWFEIPHLGNAAAINTFQVQLYDDGAIVILYDDMSEIDLINATVGIENSDASIGLGINYNGVGGAIVDQLMVLIQPIEGDFRPPIVSFTQIPETMETELPGDHLIEATITDDSGVDSASLHFQVNGGAEQTSPMTNTEGDVYTGGITHQDAGSSVVWWVTATDLSENENERITESYGFEVVSYTWPPISFQATDGLLSQTNMSWLPPVNPGLLAEWFGDTIPVDSDQAIEMLILQGLTKAEAIERWESVTVPAGRPFIEYNVYRNDELLGTTLDLFYLDNSDSGSESDVVYDYHVTAAFDAGESDASNVNDGYWGSPPNWGGPDAYGYAWVNSENPAGPSFDWADISGDGTALTLTDDSSDGPISIGFDFPFYDGFYNECYVGSNGFISFGQGYTSLGNNAIPTSDQNGFTPDNFIAMFWDDMNPSSGGTVYALYEEDESRFIVQFDQVLAYGGSVPYSFQARLYTSGIIEVMYLDVNEDDIVGATIGIENADGTIGLQYNYNGEGGLIADELALTFTPPSTCEPVDCTGTMEEEPNQGWEDGTYNLLRCDDVMCGSLISTADDTDSDWYLYTHFGGNIELSLEVSDFDGRLTLRELENGGAIVAEANVFPRCFNEALSITELDGGAYYVVVEHDGENDLSEAQNYSLSLTCTGDPCAGHEPINCAGTPEVEPNEGWNADPPNDSFGAIAFEETVCGTVWAEDGARDMDWFRVDLTGTTNLAINLEIDAFDAALFLTEFDPDGSILYEVDIAPACHPEQLNVEGLPAGSYFIVVGHNDLYGVPVEQPYALSLSGSMPEEDMCDNYADAGDFHDIYTLNEAAPTLMHHDGTGCPDGIQSPGLDRVLRLVLSEPTDLMISLTAEGEADEVILLVGDCENPEATCGAAMDEIGAGTDGESLEIPGLPAGDYFIVADFAGFGEAAPFTLQVVDMNSGLVEGRELSFNLKPNYPNPFNPSTKILWVQPEMAEANLTVYNLLGKKVLEEKLGLRGAGQHSHVWNASELPSGVYIYTLQVGDFQDTRKAVLLK